ncbi:MAG: hypothetical protein WD768_08870 [Phycisphaeraceae bacterium]
MKVAVQFTPDEELEAMDIILQRSPGMILPGHVYLLEDAVVCELHDAGVHFRVLSRESVVSDIQGAASGERI